MSSFWTKKNKPILVLAPMAGYTDSAFRELCRSFGADITMSELVSADSIYHSAKKWGKYIVRHPELDSGSRIDEIPDQVRNDRKVENKTLQMMQFSKGERPFVIQLFGKYPEKFAYAAKWVEENLKPDGIDINMGCPARKVVGSDHGVALLKNPDLAVEIVKAVKENISIPLSVKTRLGWEDDDEILEFAPKLVEAGVDALIIHGRTYKDGFKGKSRWENIYKVKQYTVHSTQYISIIGNGDIKSYEEAIEKAKNLDGVAIGRAIFGKPWIFSNKLEVDNVKLKAIILKHAKLAYDRKGEHGIIEFRKHLLVYLKNFEGAKSLRIKAVKIESIDDVRSIIEQIN